MVRVTRYKSSRKARGTCITCRKPIEAGSAYGEFAFFRQPARRFHDVPACQPRPADLEPNDKKAAIIRAEEAFGNAQGQDDSATAAEFLREAIGHVEEARDSMQEAVDNWESANLTGGDLYQSFTDDVATLDEWISDAEDVATALEDLGDEEPDEDNPEWREELDNLAAPELSW